MKKANITEKTFNFATPLSRRNSTNRIIIHHTGGADIDAFAEQIHQWHLDAGYSGIGYHFVIRKNGVIERGRPQWAVGSHAYGANYDSIGIHLSGDFSYNAPTNEQIEACALLIANLCAEYHIPIDRKHIIGHREVIDTACPGNVLFNMLGVITGKANWYRYETADVVDAPAEPPKIIFKPRAGMLSEHFSEKEFACPCCGKVNVSQELLAKLEQLRFNIGGYPLYIYSGYVCNAAEGASDCTITNSHCAGKAADICRPEQLSFGEFLWYINQLNFKNVTPFENFVHVEVNYADKNSK